MSDTERLSGGSTSRSHGRDVRTDSDRHRHSSRSHRRDGSRDRERSHRESSRRHHDDRQGSSKSSRPAKQASSSHRKKSRWDDDESRPQDKAGRSERTRDDNIRTRSRSPPSRRQPQFERDRVSERQRYLDSTSAEQNGEQELPEEDAPKFKPSGLLAAESNQKNGVALKYHEPPEARKPKHPWRMYAYKDGKEQEMLVLGAQSAYLLGRDRTVVDIPLDHPSCSKQHAVIQFRQTIETNEFGDQKKRIRPYLIDLESANGCEVNEKEIPPSRYYEIKNGDTLYFGASTREYVMIDESAV